MESDEQIYSRYLAHRSEGDFRILLERHRESLMLFLYSFVRNMEDAEELTLDAYAEAAAGADYAGKSTFKTWLFSIGKNIALMHLRERRFTTEESLEQADETADPPELNLLRRSETTGFMKRSVSSGRSTAAVAALLLIRALRSLRKGGQSSSAVPEAFAAYAWATITRYMSSGGFIVRAAVIYFAQKSRCEFVQIADSKFF
jgi:RNA polymerase sigma-70 factor (ECF subfamily)